jgi:23S rRNA (uridine2552-2'-O)-methyltransferase
MKQLVARYVPKDSGYRRARSAGYRSRAALKLLALDERFRLFRSGSTVVDLGCWPGGWLQVASAVVGAKGRVVGIDLREVDPLGLANVSTIVGDVGKSDVVDELKTRLGGRADVLLSDLAPKLSGVKDVDAARQKELYAAALSCCDAILARGGVVVVKLFSDTEADAIASFGRKFGTCTAYRPESTRKGSSEIYGVCRDFLLR